MIGVLKVMGMIEIEKILYKSLVVEYINKWIQN